jgi:hypothetical protein
MLFRISGDLYVMGAWFQRKAVCLLWKLDWKDFFLQIEEDLQCAERCWFPDWFI